MRSLSPAASPELVAARQELTDNLSALAGDLADLTTAVKAVEKDPYRYGLDVADVAGRRRFVEEAAGEVEDMQVEMDSAEAPAAVVHPDYGGFVGDDDDDGGGCEDPVSAFEHEQQIQMMREQDVQLEGVSRTVGNLREQANVMGLELAEQGEMIDALDTDVDRVQSKLGRGLKDLNKFIRKNEGQWAPPPLLLLLLTGVDTASNWCIGLLIIVLCILLFLVIVV